MKPFTKLLSKTLLSSFVAYSSLYGSPHGIYIESAGGIGLSDTIKTTQTSYVYEQGYLASLSLGYQTDFWRVELQQRYKTDTLYSQSLLGSYNTKIDGKIINSSQMLNLYYSSGFNTRKLITSVGIGLGVSSIEFEDSFKEKNILSTQALLNIGYKLNEDFILLGNYAYFYTFEGDALQKKGDNTFSLALRYNF